MGPFAFVQLEFGFLLGPDDGSFTIRARADADPQRIVVLTTLGAPQRRPRRPRRGPKLERSGAAPVPITRATLIEPEPCRGTSAAEAWLDARRRDRELAAEQVRDATRILNGVLRAHRAARADPYARDVAAHQAIAVRIGYGDGEAVARGRYASAWELPRASHRVRRSMVAPEERFAALLAARERPLACEELVLRARADLEQQRPREAALQARIALESLLAEAGEEIAERCRDGLEGDRAAVSEAANVALRGELTSSLRGSVEAAVTRMEGALSSRGLSRAA